MNAAALAALGAQSAAFARCYVQLVEALLREGVPEATARAEARATAAIMAMMPESSAGEKCPLCEREG